MNDIEEPPNGETLHFGDDMVHVTRQNNRSWFVGRAGSAPAAILATVDGGYELRPTDRDARNTTGPSWSKLVSDFWP